jgi:hypothetical protein
MSQALQQGYSALPVQQALTQYEGWSRAYVCPTGTASKLNPSMDTDNACSAGVDVAPLHLQGAKCCSTPLPTVVGLLLMHFIEGGMFMLHIVCFGVTCICLFAFLHCSQYCLGLNVPSAAACSHCMCACTALYLSTGVGVFPLHLSSVASILELHGLECCKHMLSVQASFSFCVPT